MEQIAKFKETTSECSRKGIMAIFDCAFYYRKMYEQEKMYLNKIGTNYSIDLGIFKTSLDAYEICIENLNQWEKFMEYKLIKETYQQ